MMKMNDINEGLWSSGIKRSQDSDIRKEDGKKVMTSLGVEIILKNPEFDYEGLIEDLLDMDSDNGFICKCSIHKLRDCNYTSDEIVNIKKDACNYDYLIPDSDKRVEPWVLCFDDYGTLCEYMTDVEENCCEEDYISICRGIAEAMRKMYFSFASQRNGGNGENVALLVNDGEVYNWLEESREEYIEDNGIDEDDFVYDLYNDWLRDFRDDFDDEFARSSSLVSWSYDGYGENIGIELSYDTVQNYEQYRKFARNWFGLE